MWQNNLQTPLFDYYPPSNTFIGIISIPHSGEELPSEFAPYLVKEQKHLMQDVDYKVHELIDISELNKIGVAVLKSHILRTTVDLNRSKSTCLLNWKNNSKGFPLVLSEPDAKTAELLVEKFYSPYFIMLETLIKELSQIKKTPSIVDLHSMPGMATDYHLKQNPKQNKNRPHFCLSDHLQASCKEEFIQFFIEKLKLHYSEVTYNTPYIGGHITQYIQEQFPATNNIQIEINRSIYMNEETKDLKPTEAQQLKKDLTNVLIESFSHFA